MQKGIDYIGVSVSFFCHDGEGNYVMTRRSYNCRDEHGRWDFGGGAIELGETIEEALAREVNEEYGVEILESEYLGKAEVFREHEGKPTHWIKFRYKVLVDRSQVLNTEPDKHDELGWFGLDSLPEPLHSQIPMAIKKYKDKL